MGVQYVLNIGLLVSAHPVAINEREVAMIQKLIELKEFIERILAEDWQFSWLADDL